MHECDRTKDVRHARKGENKRRIGTIRVTGTGFIVELGSKYKPRESLITILTAVYPITRDIFNKLIIFLSYI